jgi:hypothetical protein
MKAQGKNRLNRKHVCHLFEIESETALRWNALTRGRICNAARDEKPAQDVFGFPREFSRHSCDGVKTHRNDA